MKYLKIKIRDVPVLIGVSRLSGIFGAFEFLGHSIFNFFGYRIRVLVPVIDFFNFWGTRLFFFHPKNLEIFLNLFPHLNI